MNMDIKKSITKKNNTLQGNFVYLVQIEPARAFVLASSPNDTVADLASRLKLADSLLRLARFCIVDPAASSA